jgi:hypothetical protein
MSTKRARRVGGLGLVVSVTAALVASLASAGSGTSPQGPAAVPRGETLYT